MRRPFSGRANAVFLALALSATAALSAPAQAPAPAQGSTLLPGAASKEPINVAADKLDYFDKEQKAIYTGNVIVIQGDTRLNASVLTIFFDRKPNATGAAAAPGGANSGLRRMEGKGPITITSKDQVGTGDALVYDKPTNKFNLIGNVALSQGENVTRGDQLTYDLSTGQAVVSSKGRVHTLIVPGDEAAQPAPAPAQPETKAAAKHPKSSASKPAASKAVP
jgi:lipopolysaccharide export system protein LptA